MIPPVIEDHIILRCLVGSTAHGLHHPGQDDRDEMGVYLEPPEYLLGLDSLEHHIERTKPEGVRSGPGDLDLTLYSLRKWMRLAVKGNPTVLLLLFAEPLQASELGRKLQRQAKNIISQQAGPRFIGYLRAQKERLLGERGQMHVNRPELIAAHGFDTKYAMHILRLAEQGIELLTTGRLTLPMPEPIRASIMAVRNGELPLNDVKYMIADAEARLLVAANNSPLRAYPAYPEVQRFMVNAYRQEWGWSKDA